jgi:phenylacetate-coenzyme A ligase PaaK-like adenylate-forming protein
MEEASKVARWMADTKKQYGGCCLMCSPTSGAKACYAAVENGLDIKGARIIVSGEPLTPAKRQLIEAAGTSVTSRYSYSEIGGIGYGCPETGITDDIHLFRDSVAMIQHQRKVSPAEIYVDAFLFTTILPSAPKILLNMESDDYGVVETRKCSCLFGQLGFDTHIHDIRSFAKLTGSGMTIVSTDLVRILEEVLPAKYGGDATDYQLLEEEEGGGQTQLSLIISPKVGEVNEGEVIATLLRELRRVPHPGKLAAGVWAQANTIQIKRGQPLSSLGKVTTLHLTKAE